MIKMPRWEADIDLPFGTLPFDVFISERWTEDPDDRFQWDSNVHLYSCLEWPSRYEYHKTASAIRDSIRDDRPCVLPKIPWPISRYQTFTERLMCSKVIRPGLVDSVWLRTCYNANSHSAYMQMTARAIYSKPCGISLNMILDDENLYNYGIRWGRIFKRMPMLGDRSAHHFESVPVENYKPPFEGLPLYHVTLLYVVDEEAIEQDLVKIKWLSNPERLLWENRIKPQDVARMRDALDRGGYLGELIAEHAGEEKMFLGAVLSW